MYASPFSISFCKRGPGFFIVVFPFFVGIEKPIGNADHRNCLVARITYCASIGGGVAIGG